MDTDVLPVNTKNNNTEHLTPQHKGVFRVRGDQLEAMALEEVLTATLQGELVIISKGMQSAGIYEEICADTYDAIANAASKEKLSLIKDQGFERMHDILTPEEIFQVNKTIGNQFTQKSIPIVRRIVENLLNHRSGFYALKMVMARFFTPHDHFVANRKLFSQRLGSLKIQNPHQDSWFTHAENGINLWMAVGPVARGNGMLVYPDMWKKQIRHKGIHIARDERFIGQRINFALQPGDILLFHGEHLHSSELNYTQDTRYVLTSRFTLDPPLYGEGPRWIPHYYTPWLGGKLEPWAGLRSHFNIAYLHKLADEFYARYNFLSRFRNTDYDDK